MKKNKKQILFITFLTFLAGLLIGSFWSQKNYDKVYSTGCDKAIAKTIENSVNSIYMSQQKEFNSNLQDLSVNIKLKEIKNLCITGSYGLTEDTLNLLKIKWQYLDLWESRKYHEGGNNGLVDEIFLEKNNGQIIPILLGNYSYELNFNKGKCKSYRASMCCNVTNSKLKILIQSGFKDKKVKVNID